jgi:hypothetical protein
LKAVDILGNTKLFCCGAKAIILTLEHIVMFMHTKKKYIQNLYKSDACGNFGQKPSVKPTESLSLGKSDDE